MSHRYTALITREDDWYIARCVEVPVTTQGRTIEEAKANLQEAVELWLESFAGEDLPREATELMMYPLEVRLSA
jgi:predicted RNase H-like HicB family nuclease